MACSVSHAIQSSVRAGAPDFIPSVAVFLADPESGARCIYSSVVPDRNHALERVAANYPSLADASGSVFPVDDAVGEDPVARTTAFAQLFRLRSPQLMQQTVLRAVQRCNAAAPVSAGIAREGFASGTSSTAPAATLSEGGDKVWGSLAGALLASLCFLRAHSGTAFPAADADNMDVDAGEAVGGLDGVQPSSSAGRILLFSDAQADTVPSYSAECALAVAAVTASKMSVVVSCFGDAVVQADSSENRLVALASSLGGFCAARFRLADLGQLLDGDSGRAEGGSGGSRSRQKRDRIASQFVVGPTMLPRLSVGSSSVGESVVGSSPKKVRQEVSVTGESSAYERASHLGWLCPSCMAILYRGPNAAWRAVFSRSRSTWGGGSAEHGLGVRCPYCYEA